MKNVKEKPPGRRPKTAAPAKIPKAAMKQAWLAAKEKAADQIKESPGTAEQGKDTTAANTGEKEAGMVAQAGGQATALAYKAGRKLAKTTAERRQEQANAAEVTKEQAADRLRTRKDIEAAQSRHSAPVSHEDRSIGQRPDSAVHRATGHTRPAKPGRMPKNSAPAPKTGQAVHAEESARKIVEAHRRSVQVQAGQKAQRAAQTVTHGQ